jgi:hypothetical protein
MWHFDMFVTLKVFKLIGPSNDGQRHGRGTYLFFNNTPSLFVGQIFICGDRLSWYPYRVDFVYEMHVTVTNVSHREYSDLVASIRSSPVDRCGCAVVLHVGGTSMLSFSGQCWPVQCCSVLCGFLQRVDGAKRQTMTSVGEVTAEEGREKFLCTQPGIKPATSRLWDEDGTTRPLPVHCYT